MANRDAVQFYMNSQFLKKKINCFEVISLCIEKMGFYVYVLQFLSPVIHIQLVCVSLYAVFLSDRD